MKNQLTSFIYYLYEKILTRNIQSETLENKEKRKLYSTGKLGLRFPEFPNDNRTSGNW